MRKAIVLVVVLLAGGCEEMGVCPKAPAPKALPRLGGDAQCKRAKAQQREGFVTFTCELINLDGGESTISIMVDAVDAKAFEHVHGNYNPPEKPTPHESD